MSGKGGGKLDFRHRAHKVLHVVNPSQKALIIMSYLTEFRKVFRISNICLLNTLIECQSMHSLEALNLTQSTIGVTI